jgi:hypothetical protein
VATARELLNRAAKVLAELELVSEGSASRALDQDPHVRTHSAGSPAPPGFVLDRGEIHEDEESLLDRSLRSLEEWVIRAEHDRDRHKFRAPSRAPETPQQFAERIVRQYDGEHDLAVAKRENASRSYIRKIRKQAGREPLHGRPLIDT